MEFTNLTIVCVISLEAASDSVEARTNVGPGEGKLAREHSNRGPRIKEDFDMCGWDAGMIVVGFWEVELKLKVADII
jgi:hypothetical protein